MMKLEKNNIGEQLVIKRNYMYANSIQEKNAKRSLMK